YRGFTLRLFGGFPTRPDRCLSRRDVQNASPPLVARIGPSAAGHLTSLVHTRQLENTNYTPTYSNLSSLDEHLAPIVPNSEQITLKEAPLRAL
ncbi:hypothetical protein CRM22_009425, partial [Opisthorchis felineus]